MKNKLLSLFLALQASLMLYGQAGTIGDPYTSLGQSWFVPSDGIYFFDISGNTFSSYVEAGNGWILAASGDGSTTESSYPTSTALTLQSDEILPTVIYTSPEITDVRMNATSGPATPFDVESSNATVLDNLQNDRTLSVGTNSGDWTGTGTARLARSCGGGSASLSLRIYHACGNGGNMHWQVGQNNTHEKLVFSNATKNDLNLWIRTSSVPLPITLINFEAKPIENKYIHLDWQTASEIDNDFFTIERSTDGKIWEDVCKINGAGNSSSLLNYSDVDKSPYVGLSYYRLKQTDYNGEFQYSSFKSVTIDPNLDNLVKIYPNPTKSTITIIADENELKDIYIFNTLGQDLSDNMLTSKDDKGNLIVDLSRFPVGLYYVKTATVVNKVYKY